jgi:hypothetical protein
VTTAEIEAGAILVTAPKGDRTVDAVTARGYAHPALDGRTVVRLVPAALGEAEDLSMEFLGFAPAAEPVPVGHARRQALGFPAWALVNDPANGRHALALVKEMERLARVAKVKPGNAKEGYDALAGRLGSAAPHFLPTFWEQAGRAFLAAENGKMAGTCFGAARQAEQVHGLPIDEDRVADVHLEFAFAGALPAKALSEYARQVSARRSPAEAFDLVRAISVRRVAGGLPPYVGMADDLKRLAKAAGRQPDAEAESLLGELLTYPAMMKAHQGVWKAYRPALVRLSTRDAVLPDSTPQASPEAVREQLLRILPDPPGWNVDMTEDWLDLLESAGALGDLRSGAEVSGWVQRFLDYRGRGYRMKERSPRWLALLTELADRLRTELVGAGGELVIAAYHGKADLDVLDLCLATGIPVKSFQDNSPTLNVGHWMAAPDEGRRDLAAIAADDRYLPPLIRGLRGQLGLSQDERSAERRQYAARSDVPLEPEGLRVAARAWLGELAEHAAGDPTVLTLADALDAVAPLWNSNGVALHPRAFELLAAADPAKALATSLRAGLPVELVWPEYESAYAELGEPRATEAWPYLVLGTLHQAIVLGPDGVALEHVYRVPAAHRAGWVNASYVDDQLWVTWQGHGYWSGRPAEVHEVRDWYHQGYWPSLEIPGGGRTTGHRPWRVGDTETPERSHIASDGRSYWREEHFVAPDGRPSDRWREYDPATGGAGRVGQPAFFDTTLLDGDLVVQRNLTLLPAPAAWSSSPMGYRDGLVGWRVVRHRDGSWTGTGIDGRTVHVQPGEDAGVPFAAVRLPGDERPRPVTFGGGRQRRGALVTLWDAGGEHPVARWTVGPDLPPHRFWHAMRPRDPDASAMLRAADPALAERLLDACAAAMPPDALPAARSAVAAAMPGVDGTLVDAVAEVVTAADLVRRLQGQLRELLAGAPAQPTAHAAADVSDQQLAQALADLAPDRGYQVAFARARTTVLPQIRAVAAALAGTATVGIPAGDSSWLRLLPGLGAVVLRAASPVTPDAETAALRAMLAAIGELDLFDRPARLVTVNIPEARLSSTGGGVFHTDGSTIVIAGEELQVYGTMMRQTHTGLEVGTFAVPPKWTLNAATPIAGWADAERLRAAVALLAERGAAPWRPEAADRLAELTGVSRAEATLLLAGLPNLNTWHANFLDPFQREVLGLKATEAKAARDSLRALERAHRLALLDAAVPADPALLWETGPDVEAIARVWTDLFGRSVTISPELLTEAGRMIPLRNAADVVRTLAQPRAGDWLHTDGTTDGRPDGEPFESNHVASLAVALPWLAYRLPAGDPVRAALPAALELVRERLRNPNLRVGYGYHATARVPDGMAALARGDTYGDHATYHVRPEKLSGPDDPALSFIDSDTVAGLWVLLYSRLPTALAPDGTPDGRFPHDPTVSVPDLVEAVAGSYGLDPDAAAYYLQLLALPDPADKRVTAWNGWTPARLKAARAALLTQDLVVEAKRERAGRSVFLPGGWLPLSAPNLPAEAWKSGLHIGVNGNLPAGRVLVTTTVGDLFRVAWERVTTGDAPRYQSLSEAR